MLRLAARGERAADTGVGAEMATPRDGTFVEEANDEGAGAARESPRLGTAGVAVIPTGEGHGSVQAINGA